MDLLKAITQLILAQKQHPGPFLETREQELSFGTKINGIFCFIVGDISFLSFDRGYIFPTVTPKTASEYHKKSPRRRVESNFIKWKTLFLIRKFVEDSIFTSDIRNINVSNQ